MSTQRTMPRHVPTRWFDYALLLALMVTLLAALPMAWRMMNADWAVVSVRPSVIQWSEGKQPIANERWQNARNRYLSALAYSPDSPALHDELAAMYVLAARTNPPQSDNRLALYEMAATEQVTALALRPTHSWTWSGLAESMRELQPQGEDGWQAWRMAQQYGPEELLVKATLYHLGREALPAPPEDVEAWMAQTEATAPNRLRQMLGLGTPTAPVLQADALNLKLQLSLRTDE